MPKKHAVHEAAAAKAVACSAVAGMSVIYGKSYIPNKHRVAIAAAAKVSRKQRNSRHVI